MSTRFENTLILPRGVMGPTTLLDLSPDDLASVQRWHILEWDQFRNEIGDYKNKVLEAYRSAIDRDRERLRKCPRCLAMRRRFGLPRFQRGSIQMGAAGAMAAAGAGGGDCSFTISTISNLSDETIEPADARTRARLHTDGDWYSSVGSSGFGASDGTWQGDCAVSGYDSRWNRISGTVPNAAVQGTDGVWSDASVGGAAIGYDQTSFGSKSGSFNLEIRDGNSLNVLFTDAFTMSVNVDSKN